MENDEGSGKGARTRALNRRTFFGGRVSLNVAADRGSRINLRCYYTGSKRVTASRSSSFDHCDGIGWVRADRDQYLLMLWICRPPGANAGANRDDGDHKIVVISTGLHWRANYLEWHQGIAGVCDSAPGLTGRWTNYFSLGKGRPPPLPCVGAYRSIRRGDLLQQQASARHSLRKKFAVHQALMATGP